MSDITTIEERYSSAVTASSLKVEADKGGAADVLIAAGWSPSRIGSALMRLHTKADRNALEQVHEQLTLRAEGWGIDQPTTVAAAVLGWWLHKTCGACHGVKFSLIAGTPVLSTKACRVCRGSGEKLLPFGESGRRMERFIDECLEHCRASIKKRLHSIR